MEEILEKIKNVEGYLSIKEGKLLYRLAKKCKGRGAIVEIGSWMGKSTIWLGSAISKNKKIHIHAVDPHEGIRHSDEKDKKPQTFDQFQENIRKAGIADMIVPIVKRSVDAAKDFQEPIEFLFIDGIHEYSYVKQDFESWFPKVIDGGIIAFHDTTEDTSGAKRFVEETVYNSPHFKNIRLQDSITYVQKVRESSSWDRLKSRWGLYYKRQHENQKLPKWLRKIFKQLMKL